MSSAVKAWIAYAIVLAGAVVWLGLIVAAPMLTQAGGTAAAWGAHLYTFFHPICHQLDARSLHLFGEPLGVCSRCSAIYTAFLAGLLVYPFFRPVGKPHPPSRAMLGAALAPMLVDVALGFTGLHDATMVTRIVTGAVFGSLVPYVVMPVLLGAVHELNAHQPPITQLQKGSTDA
jgi:uncharacterized membrane protein